MSAETSNALIVGVASAAIGFGLAFLAFKKLISDKYGTGKEKQNKVYFWCGLIAMIAVGQGLGTIFNEFISAVVSGTSVSDEAVARGIITTVFYPGVLAIAAYILNLFSKKSSKTVVNNTQQVTVESVLIQAPTPSGSVFPTKFVSVAAVVILLVIGVYFMFGQKYFAKEWRFDVVECEVCEWKFITQKTECSNKTALKHFTVYEDKVISLIKRSDGQTSVFQSPDKDDKCFFNVDGKFSFNCKSISNTGNQTFENYREFDGKETYKSKFVWHIWMNNDVRKAEETSSTCKVKG